LCSRLRKFQAQLGRLTEDSFYDPLLLVPDITFKEFLCPYIHQNTSGIPKKKWARGGRVQHGRAIRDHSPDAMNASEDNQSIVDLLNSDTFGEVESKATVRSSFEADTNTDLLSDVSAGRRFASSAVPNKVLETVREKY
jgi:hypothetical protein